MRPENQVELQELKNSGLEHEEDDKQEGLDEQQVEPNAEVKEELRAEHKQEDLDEQQVEPNAEVKEELRAEHKQEDLNERKVEFNAEVKVEQKAEHKQENLDEQQVEHHAEVKGEQKAEHKQEGLNEQKVEPNMEVKEEQKAEHKQEGLNEQKVEPSMEVKEEQKAEHKEQYQAGAEEAINEPCVMAVQKGVYFHQLLFEDKDSASNFRALLENKKEVINQELLQAGERELTRLPMLRHSSDICWKRPEEHVRERAGRWQDYLSLPVNRNSILSNIDSIDEISPEFKQELKAVMREGYGNVAELLLTDKSDVWTYWRSCLLKDLVIHHPKNIKPSMNIYYMRVHNSSYDVIAKHCDLPVDVNRSSQNRINRHTLFNPPAEAEEKDQENLQEQAALDQPGVPGMK